MPTFTRKVLKVEAENKTDLTSVARVAHWRVTCDQDQPFKESAPLIEALVADIKKNNPQDIQAPDTTQLEETK
jgi:hypothetical protein